jgi:hypothetical protein
MQQLMPETYTSTVHDTSTSRYIAGHEYLQALSAGEPQSADAREYVLERGDYRVCRTDSLNRRSEASMLIDRRYASRGYDTATSASLPHNPNRITLEASSGSRLFGTLTLVLDSEEGLLADQLYRQEIDRFRRGTGRVCELSKLAIEPQCGSKEVLGSLFYLAYIYGRLIHKSTDVFVEVNPRHAKFYLRMLGFRQIGDVRTCPRVGAPAVLLHLELDYVDAQVARHRGAREIQDRSLYPYFFPGCETEALPSEIGCGKPAPGLELQSAIHVLRLAK